MKTKSWVLAVSVALTVMVFVSSAPAKKKMSIWLGYPETLPAYEMTKKVFEEKYPDFEVEILTFSLREFESKLAVSMPAGAGPDLLTLHDFLFPRYLEGRYLEPVPGEVSRIVNNAEIVDPVYAKLVTDKGTVYGLPYWTGRNSLYYNKDHFKQAGLEGPPKTLEEFWTYAEKLVKKDTTGKLTRAGMTMRLTGPSGGIQKYGYLYFQMAGEQVFEWGEERGKVRVTLKPNIDIAAKALMDRVNHLHGARKVDDWALKHDAEAFASGVASMLLRETWVIAFTKERGSNIDFGTAPIPCGKYWGRFNYFEILSVNRDSKVKSETWDFIRMMQDGKVLMSILADSSLIPIRKDRDYSSFLAGQPLYKTFVEIPEGYVQYVEPPNIAYEEVTRRTGEVIQEGYRDASLVDNIEGCKKIISKAHSVAATILKDCGIYEE